MHISVWWCDLRYHEHYEVDGVGSGVSDRHDKVGELSISVQTFVSSGFAGEANLARKEP